jgi:apolipoprotein N-acyltransferase
VYCLCVAPWVADALHSYYKLGAFVSSAFTVIVVGFGVGIFLAAPFAIWRALAGAAWSKRQPAAWFRVLGLASLFFLFEWMRTRLPISMPWGLVGSGVAGSEILRQSADCFGVLGISFASMLFSALVVEAIERARTATTAHRMYAFRSTWTLAAVAVPSVLAAYGAVRHDQELVLQADRSDRTIRVAAIQANIPQGERWQPKLVARNMASHLLLSQHALDGSDADLVVWPETAMNTYLDGPDSRYREQMAHLAVEHSAHFVVGGPHYFRERAGEYRYYNSMFHVGPSGEIVGRYDKIRLLAFGEYDPFGGASFFGAHAFGPARYSSGTTAGIFRLRNERLGILICFEALHPWMARDLVRRGASVLVNASNDAWFQRTKAAAQHVDQVRMRAIELRRFVVRSAGTGISTIIDPLGRDVVVPLPVLEAGVIVGDVRLRDEVTLYAYWGDWPLLVLSMIISAVLLAHVR